MSRSAPTDELPEQESLETRFTERIALLSGCVMGTHGAYYRNDIILTIRELKEYTEEDFAIFLFKHLEIYTKGQAEEANKKEAEMKLVRKQEAEKARLHAAREVEKFKREEEAVRVKTEEERLIQLNHKEDNYTDADKLREYAIAWGELEIPQCTSETGKVIEEKLQSMILRGVVWINSNSDKL
tara:strand:+ start:4427 stop:4978 length:552 start_codon:yes stop_codon:yes gene_type:complete